VSRKRKSFSPEFREAAVREVVENSRHRTKVTKGPGSRAAGLVMAFKLIESAQTRWWAVNAPQLVALVRAGASFTGGKRVVRPGEGRGRGDRLRVA
jgi:hypothetical protein